MGAKTALGTLMLKYRSEGKTIRDIAKLIEKPPTTIFNYLKRYDQTGTFEDKPKSGRPRSARTRDLKEAVRKRIKRNPNRSSSELAKVYGVSPQTIRNLIKHDLNLKCFKYQRRQVLSGPTIKKRLERGREIKKVLSAAPRPSVIWTDEKNFTVERAWNRQNDRIWAHDLEGIPISKRTVFVRQHPAHVMVWGGVTDCGLKTPLIIIPEGVKVNTEVYIKMLRSEVLPWVKSQSWEHGYVFQQDGAPSHTSNRTQAWLKSNFEAFWDKSLWPPSSPDLNPMDFSI